MLVPWRGDGRERDRAWRYVKARYEQDFPDFEIVLGSVSTKDEPWSKGAAIADAARKSHGEVLVIADADCLVPPMQMRATIEAVQSGRAAWGIPFTFVRRLNELSTTQVLGDGGPPPMHAGLDRAQYRGIPGGGITVVSAAAYAQAPVDPRFEVWGGEDEAFGLALACLFGPPHQENGLLWHLWHLRSTPTAQAPHASDVLLGQYRAARRLQRHMRCLLAGEPIAPPDPLDEPVRFRSTEARRVLRVGSVMVRFTGGEVELDDPDLVQVLRETPGVIEVSV